MDYQIIHDHSDVNEATNKIVNLLYETLQEEYIEKQKDELNDWVKIKYNCKSGDNFILGFTLQLDELEKNAEIINLFGKKLQEDTNVKLVFKFIDDDLKEDLKSYALELFEIEMRLREIISFIFIDTYKNEYNNLLKDIDIKLQKLNNSNPPNDEYLKVILKMNFSFYSSVIIKKLINQRILKMMI